MASDCCKFVLSIAGRGSVCLRVTFTHRLEDLLANVACFQFSLSDIAVTVQFDQGLPNGYEHGTVTGGHNHDDEKELRITR